MFLIMMESPKRDHLKVPQRIHYKIASLTYKTLRTSQHYSPTYHHPTTRGYSLIIISFLVSPSSLILCEVCNRSLAYAAPALWNLRQFVHPPNPHLNFSYPPLAPSSATFHSRLKTELFKISFISRFHSCTTTRQLSSPTATVEPRCLPGLTFPNFDLAPKRNEKFCYCGLDLV